MKFSIKDFFSKCDQTLNGKFHFLCSELVNSDFLFIVRDLAVTIQPITFLRTFQWFSPEFDLRYGCLFKKNCQEKPSLCD